MDHGRVEDVLKWQSRSLSGGKEKARPILRLVERLDVDP
jgi:hypothetical protein